MPEERAETPHLVAGQHLLDDLELIRDGVDLQATSIAWEAIADPSTVSVGEVVMVDPEGVPMARLRLGPVGNTPGRYCLQGPIHFMARRSDRPFESLHRGTDVLPPPEVTVVIDDAIAPEGVVGHLPAGAAVLLLVVASVERDGETEPRDIEVCRRALGLRHDLADFGLGRVDLTIVPIARDHPHRRDRIDACSTAYSRGGVVADLTKSADPSGQAGTGGVLFFTGLSGSGKSTLAKAVRNRILEDTDRTVTLLDGDVVRRHLSSGLGFSPADRDRNIRRIGWVAARIAEHGGLAICSPIAPFQATRTAVREMADRAGARFVLIHVSTPLQECERRDRKGLYARARLGEIPDFTGISSPYEEPNHPDLRLDTTDQNIDDLVDRIFEVGQRRRLWPPITTVDEVRPGP